MVVLQEQLINDINVDRPTKGHHERAHFPFEDTTALLGRLQTPEGRQDQNKTVNTAYHVDWPLVLLK